MFTDVGKGGDSRYGEITIGVSRPKKSTLKNIFKLNQNTAKWSKIGFTRKFLPTKLKCILQYIYIVGPNIMFSFSLILVLFARIYPCTHRQLPANTRRRTNAGLMLDQLCKCRTRITM